ncbi:phage tail protein [uncultured Lactobacillus sp.]|uniref:phage tail protein n=1 Tax=uncultured Lactobacillus sp. TaxID=153152 RepID=UPI002611BFE6|nr:phage tail protein [uncultured Lactobacillus sp.]
MPAIGLDTIFTGLKAADGSVLTGDKGLSESGVYEIDTNKANFNLGSKTANITNLSGTTTKIAGNNEVVDVSKGPASPQVAIDSNMINPKILNKLLGRVEIAGGGWTEGNENTESGLIIVTREPIAQTKLYYCFGRGTMAQASQNIQTNTDTAQTREDDNLTFTALGYKQFNNGKPFAIFWEKQEGFDEKAVFDTVFPGQTFIKDSSKKV